MDENRKKLSCDEFEDLISGYYENEISEADRITFKEHKKECKNCKKSYKIFKEMMKTLATDEVELPEGLHSRLMEKIQKECFETISNNEEATGVSTLEQVSIKDKIEEPVTVAVSVSDLVEKEVETSNSFVANVKDLSEIKEETISVEPVITNEPVLVDEVTTDEDIATLQTKETSDKKEEALAFVNSVKGKVFEKVDMVVTSTEGVREKAFEKVNDVVNKIDENKKVVVSEDSEEEPNSSEKTSFFTKLSDMLGMKKKTLGIVATAFCAVIALPVIISVASLSESKGDYTASVENEPSTFASETAPVATSDTSSTTNVEANKTLAKIPSNFKAGSSSKRASFEPYEVPDDFKTGSFNLVYENGQKFATGLFEDLNNDENVRVLNEQLSKRESYNIGTTTYTQGEFFSTYGDKVESYSFNQNDIPYIIEEYNAQMTAVTNQINLLESAKTYDLSNKEIDKLEMEIIELESYRDNLVENFQKVESNLGAYSYSVNVSNYNNVWRDGFFTTILNDVTSSINFTFIMIIVFFVITVILLILQKVFLEKIEELDLKKHYSNMLKAVLGVAGLVTLIFAIGSINQTYDRSYSTSLFEQALYDLGFDGSKDMDYATTEEAAADETGTAMNDYEEQVAYSGFVKVDVKNLKNASKKVDEIVAEYELKVEDSNFSNGDDDYMYISLRVPNSSYDIVYNKLLELGTVIESSKSMENYTDTLNVIDTTVDNLDNTISTSKTSLRTFNKAQDIIDLSYTIKELEFEKYYNETMATYLQDKVDYSTINLTMAKNSTGLIFLQPSFYVNVLGTILRIFAYVLSFALLAFLPIFALYLYNRICIKVFKIVRFKKINGSNENENIFTKTKNKFSKKTVVEDVSDRDIEEVESVLTTDVEEVKTEVIVEEPTEEKAIINESPIKSSVDADGIEVLSFKDKYAEEDEK